MGAGGGAPEMSTDLRLARLIAHHHATSPPPEDHRASTTSMEMLVSTPSAGAHGVTHHHATSPPPEDQLEYMAGASLSDIRGRTGSPHLDAIDVSASSQQGNYITAWAQKVQLTFSSRPMHS